MRRWPTIRMVKMWEVEDVIKASEERLEQRGAGQVYILPPVMRLWFVGVRDLQAVTDLVADCEEQGAALEIAMLVARKLEYRLDKEALAMWKSLKGGE